MGGTTTPGARAPSSTMGGSRQVALHSTADRADIRRMGVDTLSACLWEQREVLEDLAFQLESELLMVASGRYRWLARTTAGVEQALARVAAAEERRAAAAGALATEAGLAPGANLEALAEALPDSAELLRSHRRNLQDLLRDVQDLVERNRMLLARNLAATTDALAMLGVDQGYGPGHHPGAAATTTTTASGGAVLVDARA